MALSKALLVFAVLLAAAFLVSSAEETQAKKEDVKVDVQDYGRGYPGRGGGGYPGYGGGGYPGYGGGGYRGGGGYPGYGGGGYRGGGGYPGRGGGGGGCHWGCCDRGYYGGCRCCMSPEEIPTPMYRPEAEVHN
ncbi:hypothetical protein GUJ93_ZPchr0002g25967 [Zizania palustris]|uniref:Glycine rich protein n=1 Tax=Zizania palustris TaxID=103762 RepID=A0A8J5S2L5_ZIZPA|nr:hypothetical protein GUJ93_ZPchr0002g25967 [Zizania palustris]